MLKRIRLSGDEEGPRKRMILGVDPGTRNFAMGLLREDRRTVDMIHMDMESVTKVRPAAFPGIAAQLVEENAAMFDRLKVVGIERQIKPRYIKLAKAVSNAVTARYPDLPVKVVRPQDVRAWAGTSVKSTGKLGSKKAAKDYVKRKAKGVHAFAKLISDADHAAALRVFDGKVDDTYDAVTIARFLDANPDYESKLPRAKARPKARKQRIFVVKTHTVTLL